tara:strand:- start:92 stop:448 length:357 start_codon:yes stop_codon:yes gene_type:complete
LGSTALTGEEYVTEKVCPAIAGCWMNPETGECPDCVTERREVTHTHEEEPEADQTAYALGEYKQFYPNASEVQLINYEECAMTGVTESYHSRNTVGCEKYLKGRDWWMYHLGWAPDGY